MQIEVKYCSLVIQSKFFQLCGFRIQPLVYIFAKHPVYVKASEACSVVAAYNAVYIQDRYQFKNNSFP